MHSNGIDEMMLNFLNFLFFNKHANTPGNSEVERKKRLIRKNDGSEEMGSLLPAIHFI